MEQLLLDFTESVTIASIFEDIKGCIATPDLPSDLLVCKLLAQKGSASVLVLSKLMCKIFVKSQTASVQVKASYQRAAEEACLHFEPAAAMPDYISLPVTENQSIQRMLPVLKLAFKAAYRDNAENSFGCCFRFNECSDARKCTHPNHLFALGCAYRENLEQGRIFYGEHPTA